MMLRVLFSKAARLAAAIVMICFLTGVALSAAAQDAPAPAREALAAVSPENVNVDPALLKEATAFLNKEFEAKTFPGAALVATRGGRKFIEQYWGTCAGPDRPDIPFDGTVQNMMFSFSKSLTATVAVMANRGDRIRSHGGGDLALAVGQLAGRGRRARRGGHRLDAGVALAGRRFAWRRRPAGAVARAAAG